MLTKEQTAQIKEHLLKQMSNFPEDKQAQIKEKIMSMSDLEVEEFVKQNELSHLSKQDKESCIFCSIVSGKIPSYKIAENKENLAVLEINPLSKGHTIIIPKNHMEKAVESSMKLAEEVKEKFLKVFKPKEVQIQENPDFGHILLEVIPIYGNEKEKKKATKEELEKVTQEINSFKEEVKSEPAKETKEIVKEEIIKLKPRIP